MRTGKDPFLAVAGAVDAAARAEGRGRRRPVATVPLWALRALLRDYLAHHPEAAADFPTDLLDSNWGRHQKVRE